MFDGWPVLLVAHEFRQTRTSPADVARPPLLRTATCHRALPAGATPALRSCVEMARLAALAGACLLLAAMLATQHGQASSAASRVTDRTIECQVPGSGFPDPARLLNVWATPRSQANDLPASLGVSIVANDESAAGVFTEGSPTYGSPTGYVTVSRRSCQRRARLPFSTRALRGGQTGAYTRRYQCDVPAKVLIRVRATFTRPTSFRPAPNGVSMAPGTVTTATVTVTTIARRPISYMTTAEGKARILVSPSRCARG
jgi:hypothetical protein